MLGFDRLDRILKRLKTPPAFSFSFSFLNREDIVLIVYNIFSVTKGCLLDFKKINFNFFKLINTKKIKWNSISNYKIHFNLIINSKSN